MSWHLAVLVFSENNIFKTFFFTIFTPCRHGWDRSWGRGGRRMGQAFNEKFLSIAHFWQIGFSTMFEAMLKTTYPLFPGWELLTPIGEKIDALNCNIIDIMKYKDTRLLDLTWDIFSRKRPWCWLNKERLISLRFRSLFWSGRVWRTRRIMLRELSGEDVH